jgi:hypothetical protein
MTQARLFGQWLSDGAAEPRRGPGAPARGVYYAVVTKCTSRRVTCVPIEQSHNREGDLRNHRGSSNRTTALRWTKSQACSMVTVTQATLARNPTPGSD